MEYLNELNEAQRAAAAHLEGPLMVIAGAGSGKTRVLTYRIAHLIDNGVDSFNILALTFTNKAAKEMKERIGKMIGPHEAKNIWMGTFHSIFARILRTEAEKIGYPQNFTIYDTADSKSLMKTIVKEMNLDDKLYKPNVLYSRISSAKNNLISPQAYLNNVEIMSEDQSNARPKIGEIYMEYARRCYKAGAMDFDDLLFITNILLKNHPDVLLKYQDKFKYILVDEYQDTNFSQYLIVKRLAARFQNLCVVGDDAQSIYAFRGANIQNILNFKKDYPEYNLYKLEQNYRSTQVIVDAASSVIVNNRDQIEKKVWTANGMGDKIRVVRTASNIEEGNWVANDIFEVQQNEQAKSMDFAILYRTNSQSKSMEEALRKLNIPYRIYGGLSFYQRKEIKDLISYFRLVANHQDEEAFKRIINYPKRGIGGTTIDKLTIAANNSQVSLWEVAENPAKYGAQLNAGTIGKLNQFVLMIQSFKSKMEKADAFALADEIAKLSGIHRELHADKTPEGVAKYENLQELLNGIKEFSDQQSADGNLATLPDFLIDVALLTDADNDDPEDNDRVTLMTIHASKGLEFPHVYIVGLEENLFPSQLSVNTRAELEEERRLFYVAITRAEKACTLTFASTRYKWSEVVRCEPSRFIEEIDSKFLDTSLSSIKEVPFHMQDHGGNFSSGPSNWSGGRNNDFINKYKSQSQAKPRKGFSKASSAKPQTTFVAPKNLKKVSATSGGGDYSPPKDIIAGAQVEHDRFGKGKVLNVEDGKATVFFPSSGQKQLLLKFAKLRVLG